MSTSSGPSEMTTYHDAVTTALDLKHEGKAVDQNAMRNFSDETLKTHDPEKEISDHTISTKAQSISDEDIKDKPDQPAAESSDLQRQPSQAEKLGGAKIAIVMFSLCMALFLAALDITIITTALPTIAGHFRATSADYNWIGSSYLLACAAAVPLWGKVSDIWGRKPVILTANLVFMVGSLLSALANSVGMLISGRVIQGIGGGGLIILCNICVSDLFSMRERAKYFGILGMVWAVASGIGPIIGGVFTEKVSWRWCFYINLPLDGVAFVCLVLFLKLETPKTPFMAAIKFIDWSGVLLIVGGVVTFLFGIQSGGQTHPWGSVFTICLIVFGILTIGLFFINEWKFAKYPIMPLRLFRARTSLAALGICFCHGVVFIGGSYFLPLYFQTVLHATPILSGVYLLPLVLSLSLGTVATGIFIKKTGKYRPPILLGLVLMTIGFGLFVWLDDHANWPKIIIFQIIAGVGLGPNFQAPLIALQSHTKGHDVAVATATFGFVRQLAASISVVLGGVVFQNELSKKRTFLEDRLGRPLAAELAGSSFGSTTTIVDKLPQNEKDAIDQAYTSSLQIMWVFYLAFAVLGICVSMLIQSKELSREKTTTKTGMEEQERVRLEEQQARKERKSVAKGARPGSAEKVKPEEV